MAESGPDAVALLNEKLAHRPKADGETASVSHRTAPDQTSADLAKASKSESKQKDSKNPKDGEKPAVSKGPSPAEPMALPDFVIERNRLFDKLKREYDTELLQKEKPVIDVVLDLGLDKEGKPLPLMPVAAKAWESTPGSFLRHVPKNISVDVVVAKVDGKQLWDLDRPLEFSCKVSYLPFTSAEGRNVFWHSSAHVLGEAAECQYSNCLLSHGPPVEQGFFYDMAIADGWGQSQSL